MTPKKSINKRNFEETSKNEVRLILDLAYLKLATFRYIIGITIQNDNITLLRKLLFIYKPKKLDKIAHTSNMVHTFLCLK